MKKIIIVLFAILTIFFVYKKVNANEVVIPDSSIRLRVIPNSNSSLDQAMKQVVKNYIESDVYALFKDTSDITEAREIVNDNIGNIENNIQSIFDNYGYDMSFDVNYGYNYFPEKVFKNIKCTKSINFSDGSKRNIDYGTDIYYGLISYYSKDLSSKINFKIDTNSEYELYYDLIIKLKEKLNMVFETMAFNCDALTLLNAANEETLTKESDKDAVKRYITENKKKETEKTSLNIKVFPLLYIKGVQYLKYIDESKEEHLIKISNPSLTSKTYKELLTKQNTTAEDILSSLANNKEAIPDINKNLTPNSKLSHGEKDLLDTFYGKKEEIFNDELEKTQKLDRFTNIKLITEAEYEKLCMKSVNNKKLTDEELAQMEYFDIYYFGSGSNQNSKEEKQTKEENIKFKKEDDTKKGGFMEKYTPLFALFAVIILGIIFGLIIFNIKK